VSKKVGSGITISEELLGANAPVPLQGGIKKAMEKAAQIGYDSVEIQIRYPSNFNGDALLTLAERYELSVSAIGTGLEYSMNGLSLTAENEEIRKQMTIRYREYINLAQTLHSVVFLGMCRGNTPDAASKEIWLDRLHREILPIAEYAREKGVVLAMEPIVFYLTNLLNSTEETLEFLKRPGLEDIELLLDTHHMFIEDRDMIGSFRMCQGRIAHVHISDSNRRYPGGGNVNFSAVGSVLKEIGYDKVVSLEVLPEPDGETAARKGLSWMQSIWGV
jgi:sugar phosphate isomerase/epimerase